MSQIDIATLEANFANWRENRAPDEKDEDAFEIYSIEQILKDRDLSDDDIQSGNIGGGDDGGVDGMFFFVTRTLILEETELPSPAPKAELVIIQAKYKKGGFEETAIQKLSDFAEDCFDWSRNLDAITYLSSEAKETIERFRDRYKKILKYTPTLKVEFHYVTKTTHAPHPKLEARIRNLKRYISSQISNAEVSFKFWDCAELLKSVRTIPRESLVVSTTKLFSTSDKCAVCLVKLSDFANFLKDENGQLRTSLLEPNVRDFQGISNPVNTEIRKTLTSNDPTPEFWWLNNGITVIAEDCSYTGDSVTITRPEIVNGLQTSHEVFGAFQDPQKRDNRNVLLKIVVTKDEAARNQVIKATNNQTYVSDLTLRSTDRVHFDIEDVLKLHGLYYDRRKGEYKRLKKPISRIISPKALAQAVMAVYMQRPSDARARPESILKSKEQYARIFSDDYDKLFYVACITILKHTSAFLKNAVAERDLRARLRYHVAMMATCELVQKGTPTVSEIAGLTKVVMTGIDTNIFSSCLASAKAAYEAMGATDKIAKSADFQDALAKKMEKKFAASTTEKAQLELVPKAVEK